MDIQVPNVDGSMGSRRTRCGKKKTGFEVIHRKIAASVDACAIEARALSSPFERARLCLRRGNITSNQQ
eukprot:scaffold2824_cov142-Skeletonema_menzelii.AAC.8